MIKYLRNLNIIVMKKVFVMLSAVALSAVAVYAQDIQQITAEAAYEMTESQGEVVKKVKKPNYWKHSLTTQINVGQTSLTNWAAGGDNTFSLKGYIDGSCNWKKNEMFWNNRLQLDYGLLYSSSKPLFQKSNDRIYLESKWGYRIKDELYFSANYDFKSQFTAGYNYATPSAAMVKEAYGEDAELDNLTRKQQRQLWRDARVQKSGFLSPAYTTLALGIDWNPAKWVSISFAPLTGGFTVVRDKQFRKSYSMKLRDYYLDKDNVSRYEAGKAEFSSLTEEEIKALPADKKKEYDSYISFKNAMEGGSAYRSALFQFGAQLKLDFKVNVNDNFKYTSQVVLFTDYLSKKDNGKYNPNVRFNWDNKFDWKLAKYFALTLTTNMIYDTNVFKEKLNKGVPVLDANGEKVLVKRGLQFAESISFGFTYTIASKK